LGVISLPFSRRDIGIFGTFPDIRHPPNTLGSCCFEVLGVPTILFIVGQLIRRLKSSTLDNLKMKQVTYQVTTSLAPPLPPPPPPHAHVSKGPNK
jgi:hypothetical protein